jgi:hypothetical protein
MKRLASHFLILSPDKIYKRQVIEIDNKRLIGIFPLEEEIESVSWMPGIIFLSSQKIDIYEIRKELKEAVGVTIHSFLNKYYTRINSGDSIYIYFFSSINLSTLHILEETGIEEL